MLSLYPEIAPYNEAYLSVSDQHRLWYGEYGNPNGLPAVFLHGGPGSGCEAYHPRFFDPERYRIVLLDQRGAGRSRPHACLKDNTTQDLIDDLETLRTHLKIEQWVVFGGSWGSTLGLAYTQAHAQRVLGLILRGVFLCRDEDIKWFYQQGASEIFPDYWQAYEAVIPESERGDMVAAYYQRLTSDDTEIQLKAAQEWSIWEGNTSTLIPKAEVRAHFGDPQIALSLARIECHYFMNNSYLSPNQLIENAAKLASVPGYIVHGRYDVVCPIDQAYALHQVWPQAKFTIAPTSGHSATEVEIVDALVQATNELADRYT
jgi:proline iminopeptidase